MWRNDIKCKYIFMFHLKNLACNGLRQNCGNRWPGAIWHQAIFCHKPPVSAHEKTQLWIMNRQHPSYQWVNKNMAPHGLIHLIITKLHPPHHHDHYTISMSPGVTIYGTMIVELYVLLCRLNIRIPWHQHKSCVCCTYERGQIRVWADSSMSK